MHFFRVLKNPASLYNTTMHSHTFLISLTRVVINYSVVIIAVGLRGVQFMEYRIFLGGRLFKAGRLVTLNFLPTGWVLIRGWAFNQINTIIGQVRRRAVHKSECY